MLRDPTLIPLSRQHHKGLLLCVLTRRSLTADSSPENLARLAQRIVDQYELELTNHFEIEEQVLFPACGLLPIVQQLLDEHRTLEALVQQLRGAQSAQLIQEFCALLTAHIRLEESDLFEEIQQALPRQVLDRVGTEIDRRVVQVCL